VKEQEWREFAGDLDSLKFKGMQFSNHNIRAVLGPYDVDIQDSHENHSIHFDRLD